MTSAAGNYSNVTASASAPANNIGLSDPLFAGMIGPASDGGAIGPGVIAAIVVVIVLLCAAAGGFAFWKWREESGDEAPAANARGAVELASTRSARSLPSLGQYDRVDADGFTFKSCKSLSRARIVSTRFLTGARA